MNRLVLVLNQNYEPLQICNARHAVVLVYLGKAEIIESSEETVRSVTVSYPFPMVVRLSHYVRVIGTGTVLTRRNVMKRDGHRCQYCGTATDPMTIDHVIPRVRGGGEMWENLVCACVTCNNKKGNRTLLEARMTLLRKPRRPHRVTFIQQFVPSPVTEWRPYLFMD